MDQNNIIECGGFYFIHNFDSGNLGHVERVPTELIAPSVNPKTNQTETPDYEFNLWTRPDCAGTEFENGNRTWFYFGVQASEPGVLVRLNLINLNKQGKMYNQGMAPVTRTLPGKPQWERIRDRPVHSTDDNTFTLSFKYRTSENLKATTFFAFTYPFSFAELQIALNSIDLKMLPLPPPQSPDDIYYYRECLVYSLEGRRVDLLTITSHHGILNEREERLKNLFPDSQERPFKFQNKKVIFISARVHPGETPSSFVFNGFLNLLLTRNDPIAVQLRKLYVFKMIPFLNPDGVARGHYRTDTRGVNLNRVYLNPSLNLHPTVYASRALIRYYHYGCEKEDLFDDSKSFTSRSIQNISESAEVLDTKKKKGSSNTSTYKGGDYFKREKSAKTMTSNKSSTTIKPPSTLSDSSKKDIKMLSGEAAHLAEQVYDMKLQEQPSQTSHETNAEDKPSLLNDNMLRACLGSNVHLSTSEELNFQGSNPLRPLRDTLKNSISLLMESASSVAGDSSIGPKESRVTNVKMGWCQECRSAVSKLEDTMPGITSMVPGYNLTMNRPDHLTYHTIDEYREHQMRKLDEQAKKSQDNDAPFNKDENVYFCTNCFKRYLLTESNVEIKVCDVVSTQSVAVSAGDSVDLRCEPDSQELFAGSTGDPSPKDEKPKSPTTRQTRKKAVLPPPTNSTAQVKCTPIKEVESGLYLYIDLHGHASKKGIFMYGNHFDDLESCVECMLLPRIMSLNNLHFHFSSCNFTERNMYLKDRRDGMSREGSGRVAVFKATGLVRSYTLECNYNTGRLVNVLPPTLREGPAALPAPPAPLPPKYTPHIFEEVNPFQVRQCRAKNLEFFEEIDPMKVGRSLGASILDLTGQHPNSRIPCSEHRNLSAVREWLRAHTRTMRPQLTMSRLRPKTTSPTRVPLYARSKGKVTEERKENTYMGAKTDTERKRSPPVLAPRSGHDIMNMTVTKFSKKNEPVKTTSRTRYLSENEPKPKTLSTKRRNILAIRKPNSSKTQVGGVVKAKVSRRSADDTESPRTSLVSSKLSKRSFSRSVRGSSTRSSNNRCRAMASSSSDDMLGGNWEDVAGGTALGAAGGAHADALLPGGAKRRSFAAPAPPHLKKIRLKTAM
ncbi:cytosolic carboxypeptidase-like protein 5 isoform X4 [Trichoplusia ni]|uniref:Cytosolic carboxypeptidase-like protein 5 isoform X4 n=1 Tax=Trichoplusia ni TaxID=7111 RepID=A0A7E5WBB4_TRINI|nr:cytosolic carboxypeptidase-like protein 5 isoform X4 [Trichoplusia ni]